MNTLLEASIKSITEFVKLDRSLTESEFQFYEAALRFSASVLKTTEINVRLQEILAEKQLDELGDIEGDGEPKSM